MSYRNEKMMSLTGMELLDKSASELQDLFSDLFGRGIHGLCMSPYEEGQKPGDQLTEAQISRRLDIMKPHAKWVRTFSCTDGNELIPRMAKEKGFNTLVGAWLGDDDEINRREIENVIKVAKAGHADIVAVGNEVLYRNDLTEQELLDFILQVKQEIPGIPVGYVDAYYEFESRKEITEACDVILANCYPFWEGCMAEYSLLYMKDMYSRAVRAGNGKKVIITETGWPSEGKLFHGAQPSHENALKYFINAQQWAIEEDIEIFYFSSFDENWKTESEGDVGSTWGLWDTNEQRKFQDMSLTC